MAKSSKAPAGEMKYAGFWIRVLASLIDGVILFAVNFVIQMVTGGPNVATDGTVTANGTAQALGQIAGIAYTVGFWGTKSATPGKMALGLMVVDQDGKEITWVKAILRYVGYFVSALPLGLGFIWAGFDAKKQGWHDKIAGTYVIYRKQA
jgi:uncharacterized RDD family membrane protein YckC